MLNKLRSKQGFTLIELLIVVAIIGILAAIAIPQFATYRIKGFNSSSQSDVRNLSTSQAAFFADWSCFGLTEAPANLAAATGPAPGLGAAVFIGAATIPVITADDPRAAGTPRALQIPLGNGVGVVSSTSGASGDNFTGAAKHTQGDTYYGVDSDTTAIFFEQVPGSAGTALVATNEPAPVTDADDFTGVNGPGGTPWLAR